MLWKPCQMPMRACVKRSWFVFQMTHIMADVNLRKVSDVSKRQAHYVRHIGVKKHL